MRRPEVSVVVPCRNALALTRLCLTRLAACTAGSWELVAVDDGSTDGTAGWLRAFRRRDGAPATTIVRRARSGGYTTAMNAGLAAARGRIIVLGNADAFVTRGWLPAMRAALESSPRVGGVSPCSNPPARPRPRGVCSAPPWYDGPEALDRFAAAAALAAPRAVFRPARGFVPGFWFMTRRATLDAVGVLDERFAPGGFEDWDLQWRMREAGLITGFAERAFVHHEWFGVARRNGLRSARLYGPARRRLLDEKHPGAAGVGMEVRSYFAGASSPKVSSRSSAGALTQRSQQWQRPDAT